MKKFLTSEIICVGTELLLGQIVNTNAAWLARALSDLGIASYYQSVIGDNRQRLLDMLSQAAGRSDLVFLTGGLGPTQDDITMATVAEFAGQPLMPHQPSRDKIAGYFRSLGRIQVTDNNWKQALMPQGAQVLENNNGTAPGAIVTMSQGERTVSFILLPGPPSEMRPMFQNAVEPWLRQLTSTRLRHRFVRMIGIGESSAETRLFDLIQTQDNPTLAPYASEGEVVFRITQAFQNADEPDLTEDMLEAIRERLGEYIYEVGTRTMPEVVKDLLSARGLSISFAESCTAGLAMAALADFPGASAVLKGGIVAYDNQIKQRLLAVPESIIAQEGAVSEACAIAMATGCRDVMKSDLAIAITGIAGPDGGTDTKPVGTVWLAITSESGTKSRLLQLGGNRDRIRRVAVLNAYNLARQSLLS